MTDEFLVEQQQNEDAQSEEYGEVLTALAALRTARRPAMEQYERLELKIREYAESLNRRDGGVVVVAIREYNGSGEVVIDECFLKGMRVCASGLWELAYFRPHEA
jgi:hypothetical protein